MDRTTKKVLIYAAVGAGCVLVIGATIYMVGSAFRSPVAAPSGGGGLGGGGGKKTGIVGGILGIIGGIVDSVLPI